MKAAAQVTIAGTTLAPGLDHGFSSYAIASRMIPVLIGGVSSAPRTISFLVDLDGGFIVDPLDVPPLTGLPGVGVGQATMTVGQNTIPSYSGATFARLGFSSGSLNAFVSGNASFGGTVSPYAPGITVVDGLGRFNFSVTPVQYYLMFDLFALAAAANPGPTTGSTAVIASAAFDHSATIVGLQAFDASGRDITAETEFTFIGEGVPLGAPTTTPEPATVGLLATGLLALAAGVRRRTT